MLTNRTKAWSEKIPILLNAYSPPATYPILKSRQERERRRLDQFHRYITDSGISGKAKCFSLEKIKIVYKGLTYYKVLVTRNNNLILLDKNRTRKIMYRCIANMFVGLGRADSLVGFGIISELAKHTITIHTCVRVLDKIYLSNTGISTQSLKPYTIHNNGRPRYGGSIRHIGTHRNEPCSIERLQQEMDETDIDGESPRFIFPLIYHQNRIKVDCPENIARQLPQLNQTTVII